MRGRRPRQDEALVQIADADKRQSESKKRRRTIEACKAAHVENEYFERCHREHYKRSVTHSRLFEEKASREKNCRIGEPQNGVGIHFGVGHRRRRQVHTMEGTPNFQRQIYKREKETRRGRNGG